LIRDVGLIVALRACGYDRLIYALHGLPYVSTAAKDDLTGGNLAEVHLLSRRMRAHHLELGFQETNWDFFCGSVGIHIHRIRRHIVGAYVAVHVKARRGVNEGVDVEWDTAGVRIETKLPGDVAIDGHRYQGER
jgi:hypothetical protein